MNYLLDTHVCIWAIAEQNKLSARVKEILQDPENVLMVSKISLLEVVIKMKIGKLPDFKISFPEFVKSVYASGYDVLPVKDEHLETYGMIDFHESHRAHSTDIYWQRLILRILHSLPEMKNSNFIEKIFELYGRR